jgi:diaminohydroxyphosphoribosylaminopyrimidine deaminase / 5-amino-6-(5-phosphoribosylamino)uracil reductase
LTPTATPTVDAAERVHLARAIAMVTSARGTTAPNPTVGCVLLRDGEVVGQGVTRPVGGAHAEVVALEQAGQRSRGATALVTLEPCAHHGRTPPCTDALIAAGVRRVVVAHPDPNPAAAGGAATLREAGIDVVTAPDAFRAWVAGELEGFLTHVRLGRPHVTLKVAQTVDGATTSPNDGRWITGPAARRAVHRWRASVDAVLVGSGTVLADDPRLDVRDVPLGPRPQPRPVVLDGRLRTPPSAHVVARGALIVTRPDADRSAWDRLRDAGAQVVVTDQGADGHLDLAHALAAVAAAGVTSVLAEPGPTLGAALLAAGLVDRLVRHVGLEVGDGHARPTFDEDASSWRTTRLGGAGRDLIWERVPTTTSMQERR